MLERRDSMEHDEDEQYVAKYLVYLLERLRSGVPHGKRCKSEEADCTAFGRCGQPTRYRHCDQEYVER